MKAHGENESGGNVFGEHPKSRRNFLKTLGAATLGGASALVMPGALPARTREGGAAEVMDAASSDMSDELYWRLVKSRFALKPGLNYLNTGTEGSMPHFVLNNMKKDFKDFAAFPMEALLYDERCGLSVALIREKSADFLGVDAIEVVMTMNTTEGLGFCANGLNLEAGDEVITTLHFEPYNASWYFLRDRRNITLTEIELPTPATDADEIVAAFEAAITDRTKVICFCHINYTTGLRMPVKEICALAREKGIITVVDGAHAIGMLNLDLHDLGVDFYATSPHKWLCAPPGTGILYMREEMQQSIWPTVAEQYLIGESATLSSAYFQIRGQMCTPAYAGVMDVMAFQDSIGKEKIEERILSLSAYAKTKIIENWGEQSLFSPVDEELSSGLVSFNPFESHYGTAGDGISKLFYGLWDQNIVTRSFNFKNKLDDTEWTRALRLSTHIYNSVGDVDQAIEGVKKIIKDKGLS